MNTLVKKLRIVFGDEVLRKRIFITLGILVLTRVLAVIPVPGVNALRLQSLFAGSEFLNLLNLFSGGGLASLSIIMLGVGPYITASIIVQLMTLMVPKLKEMQQEEGDAGRKKIAQYSRVLAVPIAFLQGYAFLTLFIRQGVLPALTPFGMALDLVIIVAGSLLLMWLGELISEFGIGNGVSLIIFAGIVSALPATIGQLIFTFEPSQLPVYAGALVIALLVIYGVVFVTEAERPIPVTYAKQSRAGRTVAGGASTYIPFRLNQAGVIPIIFALSILLFPRMIFEFLATSPRFMAAQGFSLSALGLLANPWFYGIAYFILVVFFTYFYTAVISDPEKMSNNLQQGGAFIPGVRPGEPTADYISRTISRLTLFGALFLGFIAILPLILQGVTGIATLAIGGTSILIVVSVIVDIIKKVDAQASAREY